MENGHTNSSKIYKTNKYVEGELTETEWAEVKAQRKTYRDEINSLEEQLKQL
jgi:hypothetical protein